MSHSDLFLGWNLGPSERPPEDQPTGRSDLTRNWPPARAWDETRDLEPAGRGLGGLAQGFSLHPDPSTPAEAGETIRPAADAGPEALGADAPVPFPRCGEGIGGFRLVSELGRGAFGRVYLAEEAGLGNRPVALKVSRPEGDEPRLLARLQHTHIVPIHSVRDDPESGLRLMCMPYFGGANLAQVLEAAGASEPSEATGRSLIEALDIVGQPAPAPADADRPASPRRCDAGPGRPHFRDGVEAELARALGGPMRSTLGRIPRWSRSTSQPSGPAEEPGPLQPARRFLRQSSYVRASAWIAARLAEGLEHAHSRGLLHRDLKPSNILIAADGTPMLLDFNLAADAIRPAEGDRAMMGGTLPYMAPEHLDAFNPNGSTPPEAVDERADLYALGLILFEMVAGRHPFAEPPPNRPLLQVVREMTEERRGPAPSPRAVNREVPPGLDAIIRKCLDPDPDRRHARAGDLAEDLRRFLEDRPLKFTAEPSLAEVAIKWARRNPRLTSGSAVAMLAVLLIATIIGGTFATLGHLREVSARLKYRVFASRFQECQFLLNAGGPVENLGRGIGLAESAIRQAGVDDPKGSGAESWPASLAPAEHDEVRRDLSELILLVARARVVQAERSRSEPRRRDALQGGIARLDRAERLDPSPPRALFDERARYHSALGQAAEAARDRARAEATPPRTGRDFYLLGTANLAEGHPDRAEPLLLRAVGMDDRPFWAWFALGICHYNQGRFAESAGDFAVCTAVAPKFAWPWMNRGLALARAGRLVEALESFDRALAIDGRLAEALAHRGLARLGLGDAPGAAADLEGAAALGHKGPSTRPALAEALARSGRPAESLRLIDGLIESNPDDPLFRIVRGTIRLATDPAGAEADFRRALAARPGEPGAYLGLARLHQSDPRAALPDLDRAVEGDPALFEAVELRALLRARLGDPAALTDVDRLVLSPTPHRLYNAACALALLSKARPDPALVPRALALLVRALESGFPREPLRDDPDLDPLRDNPAFGDLLKPGP